MGNEGGGMRRGSREPGGQPSSAVRERAGDVPGSDNGGQERHVNGVGALPSTGALASPGGAPPAPPGEQRAAPEVEGSPPGRAFNFLKWLYPGIGVKRWFFLALLATLVVAAGVD